MKYAITLIILFLGFQTQAQLEVNGVTLPAKLSYSNTSLSLNGGGVRSKFFFKLYSAGLYLNTASSNAKAVVSGDEDMAIRLVITSDKINSDNMSEAIREGFDLSTGGNTSGIATNINKLINTFSAEAIVPGNVFDIVYVKGKGVLTYKNGKLKSTIDDFTFKKALFGIWLSDDPISSSLKDDMLGK